jgi:hypothetical protein
VVAVLNALAIAGMAILIGAPITSLFLFRHEEKPGYLPHRDNTGPVTFPGEDNQREEVPR